MEREKFKSSENVLTFRHVRPFKLALYNNLNMSKLFGDENLLKIFNEFKTPKTPEKVINKFRASNTKSVIDDLIGSKFILPLGVSDEDVEKELRKNRLFEKPKIDIMYAFTTNRCNFDCKYCSIEGNKPCNFAFSDMSEKTAKASLDTFSYFHRKTDKHQRANITFYGGEPLLNEKIFKYIVRYSREIEKSGYLGKGLGITLVTNGTLLSKPLINFIQKNDIALCISIDGKKKHHDLMRRYADDRGTWNDVIRNFNMSKKNGVLPAISCTIGSHNVRDLEDIAEYFATELGIHSMGFNFLIGVKDGNRAFAPPGLVAKNMVKAFEVLRRYGVYEDRMMRRVKAFVEEVPRFKDCAGYGGQLAFSPNGDVGSCHVLLEMGKYIIGNVNDRNIRSVIEKSQILKDWSKITPYNIKGCKNCEALGVCGGCCAYDSLVKYGNVCDIDDFYCKIYKFILEWLMKDMGRKIGEEMKI